MCKKMCKNAMRQTGIFWLVIRRNSRPAKDRAKHALQTAETTAYFCLTESKKSALQNSTMHGQQSANFASTPSGAKIPLYMLRTLKQLKNIKGKRVLLRVDFNVPIDKRGVTDDTRIKETLPTIKLLLKKGAKVIVMTHLGRPEGHVVDKLKLDAVAVALQKLLKKKVHKLPDCIGKKVEAAIEKVKAVFQ